MWDIDYGDQWDRKKAEWDRRTTQFVEMVAWMAGVHLAEREIGKSPPTRNGLCSLTVINEICRNDAEIRQARASGRGAKRVTKELVDAAGGARESVDGVQPSAFALPDEGWREDDESFRSVRVYFEPNRVLLSISRPNLSRVEGEYVLRKCPGFGYSGDPEHGRRYAGYHNPPYLRGPEHESLNGYEDPLFKLYSPGEERAIAEDMAFVLFKVWNVALDWTFFVTAHVFLRACDLVKHKPLKFGESWGTPSEQR